MQRLRKNKTKFKIMAFFTILLFSSTVFASGLPAGRIIPNGKVALFKGTKKVGEYHAEAPLPNNTLLSVQGQCGIKLNDAYLVATDKSLFAINSETSSHVLAIEHGTVYFALAGKSLSFRTPDKMITTNDILLNASSDSGLLKGYISVADDSAKIGVIDGGSMLLSVNNKPVMIKSGQELLLSQADLFDLPEEQAGAEAGAETATETAAEAGAGAAETAATAGAVGGISTQTALIGLGVLAVGGAAAAAGGGGGGGGGGDASPSSP